VTESAGNQRELGLSDLLTEDCVLLDAEAKDRVEAIRIGCDLLVRAGAVTGEYLDLILQSLEKNGPYFVIVPHFALSHARAEHDCVRRPAMSLVRLQTPVPFGNSDNDPVRIVLTLATPDDHVHIQALAQLSELLMKEDTWNVLETGTASDILQMVRSTRIQGANDGN